MKHLKQLGTQIHVPIPRDHEGYVGRECPDCERYFKVTPGTGLTGTDLPCVCPYCGHQDTPHAFFTRDQIDHARSVVFNKLTAAVLKDLKTFECNVPARGAFGLGFSMKVSGAPAPIRRYREKTLETELTCEACTLRYAVYGLFAFCPDCGAHNSRQILESNLVLVEKMLGLAKNLDGTRAVREQLRGDALENVVSAFDAFGRQLCAVAIDRAMTTNGARKVHFQNLLRAEEQVRRLYRYELASVVTEAEWAAAHRGFQKRHLLAHSMGIVDEEYVRATGDHSVPVGRKVIITDGEVTELIDIIRKLADGLVRALL